MKYEEAKKVLEANGQGHVLQFWDELDKNGRAALLKQIATIDFKELARCASMLEKKSECAENANDNGIAPKVMELKGRREFDATITGMDELSDGKMAVLLVAGGQGSRLGYDGPKGCYGIGPMTNAPLFFFHARKVVDLELHYGRIVPLYIMTSEANDAATKKCFANNRYFGLRKENVIFFTQGMWPGMTEDGKIIMEEKGKIFMSPDGHGGVLAALKRSGALADMKARKIRDVFFLQVDNPLVDIGDAKFLGYHLQEKSEYSLKLCAKRDPFEKVGMPMKFGGKYRMVEYTEMTDEQCRRKGKDGELYYRYGSPAIHIFDRQFLEREANKAMPLHLAHKKIAYVDAKGRKVNPEVPNGYKFEKFIFDILPDAKRVAFLAFRQEDEFSPVKNAEGADSPETCRAAMIAKWHRKLAAKGIIVEKGARLEVDPCLH